MPALNDLRAAIIGDRAAAVPFPFLFLPDLLSLVRGSRFVPRICSIRRSIPTGCSHPPTRWAVARRRAWAYISLSRRARMQRSSYDLTVAFPFAEGSAAEKLLTKGCRNTADRFRLRNLRWEARGRDSRCRLRTRPNGMRLPHVALLQNSLAT